MKSKFLIGVVVLAASRCVWAGTPVCAPGAAFELVCKDFHTGEGAEWQHLDVCPDVQDWRGYDRFTLHAVCEGPKGMNLKVYVGEAGKPYQREATSLDSCRWRQWTFRLNWPAGSDPSHVRRLHFYTAQPHAATIRFAGLTLLKPGEKAPPPPADNARFMPVLRKLLDAAVAERDAARGELEEAKRHPAAFWAFRAACDAAGQKGPLLVGKASSMERIRPRAGLERPLAPADNLAVRLARGESEGLQVIVSPRAGALANVRVAVGTLRREDGAVFPASNVLAAATGYWRITGRSPYKVGRDEWKDGDYVRIAERAQLGWFPDPILAYTNAADVAEMDFQSFWLRFRADRDQPPGVYRGQVTVSAQGAPPHVVPIAVRVNSFTLPVEAPMIAGISWNPEYHAADNAEAAAFFRGIDNPRTPVRLWKNHKMEWVDFLADHYISMDCIYRAGTEPLDVEVCRRLAARGRLAPVNLGYWTAIKTPADEAAWRRDVLAPMKARYAQLQAAGLAHYAYAYGCDELEKGFFGQATRAVEILKQELPGVPLATTAYDHEFGVGTPLAGVDWWTPLIDKFDPEKAAKSRAAGHKVLWYVCCAPNAPWPNCFVDSQAVEMRLLQGAMAARMKPDGFLIYEISIWNATRGISGGPFIDYWSPRTWRTHNGDGCWTCADAEGRPLPTIRLENYRDGVEDLQYVRLLEKRLAATPDAKGETAGWREKARALLAVPQSVMKTMQNYTDDPAAVYGWRDAMADLLEEE